VCALYWFNIVREATTSTAVNSQRTKKISVALHLNIELFHVRAEPFGFGRMVGRPWDNIMLNFQRFDFGEQNHIVKQGISYKVISRTVWSP